MRRRSGGDAPGTFRPHPADVCLDAEEAYNYVYRVPRNATWVTRKLSAVCCGLYRYTCINESALNTTILCMYGVHLNLTGLPAGLGVPALPHIYGVSNSTNLT